MTIFPTILKKNKKATKAVKSVTKMIYKCHTVYNASNKKIDTPLKVKIFNIRPLK